MSILVRAYGAMLTLEDVNRKMSDCALNAQ